MFQTIEWTPDGTVRLIDQRRLPLEEIYVECRDVAAVADAIRTMQIRGAPAIGVAGAMGLALAAKAIRADSFAEFFKELSRQGEELVKTRPTAVNLAWGIDRMKRCAEKSKDLPIPALVQALIREAQTIREEDIRGNRAMGEHGRGFIADGAAVLTHCNAGALATAGDRATRGADAGPDHAADDRVLQQLGRLVTGSGLGVPVTGVNVRRGGRDRDVTRPGGHSGRRSRLFAAPVRHDEAGHEHGRDHESHPDGCQLPRVLPAFTCHVVNPP